MYPKVGTVSSQRDLRRYLRPEKYNSFGKFRGFKDPISSFDLA